MFILASGSKRRINLLNDAGLTFKVIPSDVDEIIDDSITPVENVKTIAKKKALDIYNKNKGELVIAADTIVVLDNKIFGKPETQEEAYDMLKRLSNKTHEVMTAVAFVSEKTEEVIVSISKVTFKDLSDEEIYAYIETKEPFGKAGAYAIQGIGKEIIETYEGDFFTIVGLPLKEVLEKLKYYKI